MPKDQAFSNEIRDRGVRHRYPRNRRVLLGFLVIGQVAGMLLMTERLAHAYVDPGSGLFTLQMLGASIAGGLFFLRHKLRKVVRGKSDKMPREKESAASQTSADQELAAARRPRIGT